jgi:anti-sigma factor RsiW
MFKDQDSLEYALSQYLDGTLNESDRRVLEERLASDAEARLIANEYARLNQLLKTTPIPPDVDFESLHARISEQVEAEPPPAAQPVRLGGAWSYRLAWAAGIAVLIGAGLYWKVLEHSNPPSIPADGVLEVQVVLAPTPQAPASMVIDVGPTETLKQAGYSNGLVDSSVLSRPARIVISSADAPSANGDRLY